MLGDECHYYLNVYSVSSNTCYSSVVLVIISPFITDVFTLVGHYYVCEPVSLQLHELFQKSNQIHSQNINRF